MPPRYAFWTILIDGKATAFRAREKEELLPTFQQLKRTNKDVVFKWYARGQLWATPEEAQAALRAPKVEPEKRGGAWRPGGAHADPRARFKKKSGARSHDTRPPSGAPRPWRDKPTGPPRGDRPWGKPPAGPPRSDRPWSGRPPSGGPPRGDRPWSSKPPTGAPPRGNRPGGARPPRSDRSWSSKPPTPWSSKPPTGGPPRSDRPWRDKKFVDRTPKPPRPEPVPDPPPPPESIKTKPEPPERG